MQHLKVVYDVLTDNRKNLAIRDFTKAMSRLNIRTQRKRVGGGKQNSAPRGVVLTWNLDPDLYKTLLEEHFDSKDIDLLHKEHNAIN